VIGTRLVVLFACAAFAAPLAYAQAPPAPGAVEGFVARFDRAVQSGQPAQIAALFTPGTPEPDIANFAADVITEGVVRAIVRERDRVELDGALPGEGYRLVLELFLETPTRARIVTTIVDVRRPSGGDTDSWAMTATQGVTSVEGLYRLQLDATTQFAAKNLTIEAEDLRLTLEDGTVFLVEGAPGVTGVVLLGRGTMLFSPAPQTERGQLRIFAGTETLNAGFESAYIRMSPSEYERRVSTAHMVPMPVNPRMLRRAQEVFAREGPKSFSLDLGEVSDESWYLLPPPGDFLADVRTRRHGTLTYSRSGVQAEDITVFDRERRRTIALYSSAARLVARGEAFNEDDLRDYDVLHYDIEATIQPEREQIEGRARLRLRTRAFSMTSLTLRLADALTVSAVASVEHGRLLHLRIRNQNTVIVNMPGSMPRDSELTLLVVYSGRVVPQEVGEEALQTSSQGNEGDGPLITAERNFLLSNRSFWYPQNPISDYATATLRITVPEAYGAVASGDPRNPADLNLRDLLALTPGVKTLVFSATDPLRYLAVVVSRFTRVAENTVAVTGGETVRLAVDANPRQQGRGRALMATMQDIIEFYSGLLGDAPYRSATIALVEDALPGGHSPGYFAVLNSPLPYTGFSWRNDPAAFSGFPDFFIAHELAHQWWGQAVGWRNYHEQWISEGFAQYFAALYARQTRGEQTFNGMLRQFRRWAVNESDEGPISLGYRLGHIKGEPRVLRALIYNKAAAVLHMLRLLIGDQAFFTGLRRFYAEEKFQKTGTDDLRRALEAESGRSLERFFERWIHGAELPRLRYATTVSEGTVTARFDQVGEQLFDVPVKVSITYTDGRTHEVVVPVTDRRVEHKIPAEGTVRQVQVNRDFAAVAIFEQS
jgi:hypothetical protein